MQILKSLQNFEIKLNSLRKDNNQVAMMCPEKQGRFIKSEEICILNFSNL